MKITTVRNPLTIIAIFAGLAEACSTGVLPFLDSSVQGIFVWFVMAFPLVLVGAFFLTLNFNRHALYAPSDFSDEEHYLRLDQSNIEGRKGLAELPDSISKRIEDGLTSSKMEQIISEPTEKHIEGLRSLAKEITDQLKQENFFSVTLAAITGNPNDEYSYPASAFSSFNDLTDQIWHTTAKGKLKAFTYGTNWVLRDISTGKIFKHARMITGQGPGKPVQDDRSLDEVGIRNGMRLEVIPPPKQ